MKPEVWLWLEQLFQDGKYGARLLRRDFAFTTAVVLTLALAIGLNIAVFGALDAVLLRPLPYPSPDRLLWVVNHDEFFHIDKTVGPDFLYWRAHAQSFEAMTAYAVEDQTLAESGYASAVRVALVAGDFWAITGTTPSVGRFPAPSDPNAAVLSHRLYEGRFHGDPAIVGKLVKLDGKLFIVRAVLPENFQFLFPQDGGTGLNAIGVYASLRPQVFGQPIDRLNVVAQLKNGVPASQAAAELLTLQTDMLRAFPGRMGPGADGAPGTDPVPQIRVLPLQQKILGSARLALFVLFAAVCFVALIACSNVANLLLARVTTRQKEVAIRASLGAGRRRIARQFLTESSLIAVCGGALGLVLAHWVNALIIRLGSTMMPRLNEIKLDGSVLTFALILSLGTGILLGCGPVISLLKADLNHVLKDGGAACSNRLMGMRGREVLVTVELALAIVLLTGAGLMVKSFWRMTAYPPGFEPQHVLVMHVTLSGPQYLTADGDVISQRLQQRFYMRELVRRIEAVPGAFAGGIAVGGFRFRSSIGVEGAPTARPDDALWAISNGVSSGYFRALGMRLVKGHWFTGNPSINEILINGSLARRLFGNSDPIGRRVEMLLMSGGYGTVVGVVADLHYPKLDAPVQPEVYFAFPESPSLSFATIAIRTAGDPLTISHTVRKLISGIDPTQAIYDVEPLEQTLLDSVAPRRFEMVLLAAFAAAACLLALIGIYGLIAYVVAQRTREIGIRIAIGAQPGEVVRMLISKAMVIAVAGIAVGMAAAGGLTRLMGSLLYNVNPIDLPTFCTVGLALAATALLASWIPSRRAAGIDPMESIRSGQ